MPEYQPTAVRPRRRTAARQSSLRAHNLAVVLGAIHGAGVPLTRAQVATATGLTRATVSSLVDALVQGGLVDELSPRATPGAGRPGTPLVPSAGKVVGLGLGIQVDQIRVEAIDIAGNVVAESRSAGNYRRSDPAKTIQRLSRLAHPIVEQLADSDIVIAGVSTAVPGLITPDGQTVRLAPNLGWEDVELGPMLRATPAFTDIPVTVGNDADFGAIAEYRRRRLERIGTIGSQGIPRPPVTSALSTEGAPASRDDFLFVAGEVGIGGALMVDGTLVGGIGGWSGEIGHAVVDPDGPLCGCGATGCLETFAGQDRVMRAAGLNVDDPTGSLAAAARSGNKKARRALADAADALGRVISVALNLVDVETVVLGGFYSDVFEHLRAGVEEHVSTRVLTARWKPISVEAARGDDVTGATGAALHVTSSVLRDPAPWIS